MRSAFGSSKRDKRTIKHSALISRIEKQKPSSKKRRRPSKKLISNLESLANALPEISNTRNGQTESSDPKIKHNSMKSRPGAMKKKESIIVRERERFNRNMAQMMTVPELDDVTSTNPEIPIVELGTKNKWAAIREFIKQTMEQAP